MSGYIMTLGAKEYIDLFYSSDKEENKKKGGLSKAKAEYVAKQFVLEKCFREGTYSAICSKSGGAFIGTMADYLGMKEGDEIFFFKDRTIYGIGQLVNLANLDCRFRIKSLTKEVPLVNMDNIENHQFICSFKPAPFFFRQGVDMDEVLQFNPEKMKSLRFFSQRSFMKLDDFESEALKNIIVRKNEQHLRDYTPDYHYPYSDEVHRIIEDKLKKQADEYKLSVFDYIGKNQKKISSEYYIEGAIMDLLRKHDSKIIGRWDFIGRQYPASPPKPSEYAEAMDLFGYRYVDDYPGAISKYIVIELKVGTIKKEHVQQTMKYVDWISREYAKGDYSMIEAYTIGKDKEENLEENIEKIIERNYITGGRPVKNSRWNELRILSYHKLLQELMNKENGNEDA